VPGRAISADGLARDMENAPPIARDRKNSVDNAFRWVPQKTGSRDRCSPKVLPGFTTSYARISAS